MSAAETRERLTASSKAVLASSWGSSGAHDVQRHGIQDKLIAFLSNDIGRVGEGCPEEMSENSTTGGHGVKPPPVIENLCRSECRSWEVDSEDPSTKGPRIDGRGRGWVDGQSVCATAPVRCQTKSMGFR